MQTGPVTKRGKTKSSMNALTHGLTSQSLISDEEQALYKQTVKLLNEEYQPMTFTENVLIERVAAHYVRLQRAIKAEAAAVETGKINIRNCLSIQQTFELTDSQAHTYAVALSNGTLTPETNRDRLHQLMTQAAFKELTEHDAQKRLHISSLLTERGTVLEMIFSKILLKTDCAIEELIDGRFTLNQILSWAVLHGDDTPVNAKPRLDYDTKKDRINVKDLNTALLKIFGELTIAIQIHPDVKNLESLSNNLGLTQSADLDKINRHLTNADRQFSKALGELRHVIDERKRREAFKPAA